MSSQPTPPELQSQVNLDNINFVTNERLLEIMRGTTATPEQVEAQPSAQPQAGRDPAR